MAQVRRQTTQTTRQGEPIVKQKPRHGRCAGSLDEGPSSSVQEFTNPITASDRVRALLPSPPFRAADPRSSVPLFLAPSALPAGCKAESTDVSFKSHLNLLRRLTCDNFDAHTRYFFIHKPLARADTVLKRVLLGVPGTDGGEICTVSPELRASALYVACNVHRSVYGMAYAGQVKSIYRIFPPSGEVLYNIITNGAGLPPDEDAALDHVFQVASNPPAACVRTTRLMLESAAEDDNFLGKQMAALSGYAAFMSRARGSVDVELSYDAVKYAAKNLSGGLLWSPSGRHFNQDQNEDEAESKSRSHRYSSKPSRGVTRRIPNFISSSVTIPRLLGDSGRVEEAWMRNSWMPVAGNVLEMNDCIWNLFGFAPFYLSVAAVANETTRRALVFGAKELLFQEEGEISRRLKFIVCYVSSLHMAGKPDVAERTEKGRSTPPTLSTSFVSETQSSPESVERRGTLAKILRTTTSDVPISIPDSTGQLESEPSTTPRTDVNGGYDPVAICCAHAAFLACRFDATAAELVAAADEERVREVMDWYMAQPDENADVSAKYPRFPLSKRDCAVVLLGHAIAKTPAEVGTEQIQYMESAFGSPYKMRSRGGRSCHKAFLEVVGASSMWALFERYSTCALSFEIDLSANVYFAGGCAEPAIVRFARDEVGKRIGLTLGTLTANRGVVPANVIRVSAAYSRKLRHRPRPRSRSSSFIASTGEKLNRMFIRPSMGERRFGRGGFRQEEQVALPVARQGSRLP